ncbi:ribonuclease BN [Pandoravirus japonicus]|uniref:Anti-Pycsar protein Apyc1 n=1 Tax=Pandoravirus japonicus TaxID=2823154 RepID=A0A811BN96_9VIRU|nr:ribonuclease BN [Pandoravirus japonicus]
MHTQRTPTMPKCRHLLFAMIAMAVVAAAAASGSGGHGNGRGHGNGHGRNWRESEYSSCSAVPTVCRSDLCDTTAARSRMWDKWSGIDIMTHGTGSPQPTSGNRYATGITLPDGTYLLVDAGTGIARDLGTYKCQDWTVKLRHFAMTHYHSDHIGDMGFALNLGFVRGRRGAANKVQVYGPQGLTMLADALRTFYAPDAYARVTKIINGTCRHVGDIGTADSLWFDAHEFAINETNPIVPVFSAAGVSVTAILVNHISFTPAVGFVIQTPDVKVVLSGDTAYSPLVESMALDADYLVHEVTNQTWANAYHDSLVAAGAPNADSFYCGGRVAHTSIEDLAALAQRSRVKNLVLSHILPEFDDKTVLEDAIRDAGYTYGRVYAANDGDYWKVLKAA